jgi:outer membrane protein assembly factor BamB
MRFLSSDFLAIGISAVIITTFSGLLYHDFTRKLEGARAEEIGVITYKKRVAQRKYATQVIWEDVEQNVPVYNNDSIRTSEMSEAIIHLKDGTDIELDDDSMILLAMSEGAINVNFSHGTIYAKRGDITGKDIRQVNIVSKDATVSIEKSDVKLSKVENKELNLNVSKGTARVHTERDEITIEKDQKVVVLKDTKEAKVYKQRLKLISPAPNSFFISMKGALPVGFSWEPVSGARVLFELSRDDVFSRTIDSSRVSANTITRSLPGGEYHWRLKAVDTATGRTEVSESRKLTVIRDSAVQLINPQNRGVFTYSAKPPIVNFKWLKNEIASGYILEISPDSDFASIIRTIEIPLTDVAVDNLTEGMYYWRVKTSVDFSGVAYSGRSPTYRFSIARKKELEPPELIFPAHQKRLSAEMIKGKGVVFSWKADNQFSRYEIFIARDENFSNMFLRDVVNGNFYTMKRELPAGNYFWRIIPVVKDEVTPVFSATRQFDVVVAEKLKLIAPMNKSIFNLKEDEKQVAINFNWQQSDIKGNFLFELSREEGFIPLYHQRILSGNALRIDRIEPGNYLWRVKLLDTDKSEIAVSETYSVNVQRPGEAADLKVAGEIPGETPEKAPEKIPEKSFLFIRSPIKGSAIYVNSKRVGYGEVTLYPKAGEKLSVEVVTKGYFKFKQDVVLNEGERKIVSAKLVRIKKDERIKWTENLKSPVKSKPIYHNNVLIVSANDGRIVGLNKNGNRVWGTSVKGRSEATPAVSKSTLYTVTVDGYLHAVNVKDGSVKWRMKIDGPLLFGSKPLVAENRIYVATSFGVVHAFSDAGKELWKKQLEGGVYNSMAYHRGVVYVGTDSRKIYALSAEDGDEQWTVDVDSRMVSSAPKIYRDSLFVGTYRGSFYAIDIKEGQLKWQFKAQKAVLSTPVFLKDIVYFGSVDGYVYALNLDKGEIIWKYDTGDKILVEPIIANNLVYIPSGKTIYALSTVSGSLKWKAEFKHEIRSPATAVGNDIYIGLENGEVVALRSDLTVIVK